MTKSTDYRRALEKWLRDAESSARVVAPLVVDLLNPTSVVDVGCGLGAWLAAFGDLGVTDLFGIDGVLVSDEELRIPSDRFRRTDLARPFRLDRSFDLVVCLEVGEHLPEEAASTLVASLAALGDQHLFSAAIPFQGGKRHINEQWPQYWIDLFADHGLRAADLIRPQIWDDERVGWWYAQNIMVFASDERIAANRRLNGPTPPAIVHPQKYLLANRSIGRLILSRTRACMNNRSLKR